MKKYNSIAELHKRLSGTDILVIAERERRFELLIRYHDADKQVLIMKTSNNGVVESVSSNINAFIIEEKKLIGYGLLFVPALGVKNVKYAIWVGDELIGHQGMDTVGGILEFLPTDSIILNKIITYEKD